MGNGCAESCEGVSILVYSEVHMVMSVLLRDTPPPFQEVGALGRECVPVYAFMWESAARDERGNRGGTCHWTVKGLSNQCSMSRTTVITALKKLLDGGFIQIAEFSTPYDRVWRVTHPKHLAAVRHAIDLMGLPSLKYNDSTRSRHDSREAPCQSNSGDGLHRMAECAGLPGQAKG